MNWDHYILSLKWCIDAIYDLYTLIPVANTPLHAIVASADVVNKRATGSIRDRFIIAFAARSESW